MSTEAPRLRLLGEVTWCGATLPGERGQALLAVLAGAGGKPVTPERLAAEIWGDDDAPANPGKALQVLVSRTRAATGPELVAHSDRGYRLAIPAEDVDTLALGERLDRARAAMAAGDLVRAADQAARAAATQVAATGTGALAELRDLAREQVHEAVVLLGRSRSALGEHGAALPHLETAVQLGRQDDDLLAALLRSEAAVRGAPAALERYERHRRRLRDELGSDPGEELRRVHAELLAADRPERSGLRGDATALVGRDDDLRELRAAVATSRVVTILGPGGLGKTRLANVLAREARQSVVHLVELVGVRAEDVIGEIGSALGVRDSVAGRRVLTPEQRADVRARIAQHLDRAPSLLILDNCEHVIDVVADLVAFLVAAADRLTVVTTSRTPLAIGAEQVFALGQLDTADAERLFVTRARAARRDVALPEEGVRRVVERLDGLPLAIELAAARTRSMTVEDIAVRLDDRFALLRGGDRTAPDRHRTLLAVVDWSWQLLDEPARRALERLALFQDGFGLAAAAAVLPGDALATVTSLVDQSLLGVDGSSSTVRFRMLETVREFGLMRLRDHGEEAPARAAVVAWARTVAEAALETFWSVRQAETIEALLVEEGNLVEVLRDALAAADVETSVLLVASVGTAWTVRGEHPRVFSLAGAVDDVVAGWEPADELVDAAVAAASVMAINTMISELAQPDACRLLLTRFALRATQPAVRAMGVVMSHFDPRDQAGSRAALDRLSDDPDPRIACLALQWSSHGMENAGDPGGAIERSQRALDLVVDDDGPWQRALLDLQLGGLHHQLGDVASAVAHARRALPVLERIGATDDVMQVYGVLVVAAIEAGDLAEADRIVARFPAGGSEGWGGLGVDLIGETARAELHLARGRIEAGLERYRATQQRLAATTLPGLPPPDGLEPWQLIVTGAAVAAYAIHGEPGAGDDLARELRNRLVPLVDRGPDNDLPILGMVCFALGLWGLLRQDVPAARAVAHLAVAERLAYARSLPSLSWPRAVAAADAAAPGELAAALDRLGSRRGPDLLPDARSLVD